VTALDLHGKHAFVAGVGSGIGGATVRALAGGGAQVSCFDVDTEAAATAAESIDPPGTAFTGDARRLDDVRAAVDAAVAAHGDMQIVVDVIGEARWGRTTQLDDAAWDESFDLVLRHFFNLVRATGPLLAAQGGGSIICIASVSGLRSAPLHGAYGAAKAGLMSLVRTLAVELARDGVRVNAVAPGAVMTPRVAALMSDERRAESAAQIPLGRHATPDEIANAIAFLASDLASYITGQTLVVDGGATAQFPLSLRA
jgi:NAD(P)-dependent dehydrogenase (short-subunit alcohol dehydrogenase family)